MKFQGEFSTKDKNELGCEMVGITQSLEIQIIFLV